MICKNDIQLEKAKKMGKLGKKVGVIIPGGIKGRIYGVSADMSER